MEEQQYKLLDGKAVSAQVKQEMAEEVARIKAMPRPHPSVRQYYSYYNYKSSLHLN